MLTAAAIRAARIVADRSVPINAPLIPPLCAGAYGATTVGVAIRALGRCAGASVSVDIGVHA
jgi:hypothetical protein